MLARREVEKTLGPLPGTPEGAFHPVADGVVFAIVGKVELGAGLRTPRPTLGMTEVSDGGGDAPASGPQLHGIRQATIATGGREEVFPIELGARKEDGEAEVDLLVVSLVDLQERSEGGVADTASFSS